MENGKLEKVDLNNLKSEELKELVKVGLINEQGFRISGQGILIEALGKVREEANKTNKQLYFIEKNILERLDKAQDVEREILKRLGEIVEKIK